MGELSSVCIYVKSFNGINYRVRLSAHSACQHYFHRLSSHPIFLMIRAKHEKRSQLTRAKEKGASKRFVEVLFRVKSYFLTHGRGQVFLV